MPAPTTTAVASSRTPAIMGLSWFRVPHCAPAKTKEETTDERIKVVVHESLEFHPNEPWKWFYAAMNPTKQHNYNQRSGVVFASARTVSVIWDFSPWR